jgi:hypothetical protein
VGLVMQCAVPGGICASIREAIRHCCANMETAAHANTLVLDIACNRGQLLVCHTHYCFRISCHRIRQCCFVGNGCVSSVSSCRSTRDGVLRGRGRPAFRKPLLRVIDHQDHGGWEVRRVATFALQLAYDNAQGSRIMLRHPTEYGHGAATSCWKNKHVSMIAVLFCGHVHPNLHLRKYLHVSQHHDDHVHSSPYDSRTRPKEETDLVNHRLRSTAVRPVSRDTPTSLVLKELG